jgi:hypothetical protein
VSESVLLWDKLRIHMYRMEHGKLRIVYSNSEGAWNCQAPPGKQNDYRTFCMSDESEKVYHKLKEVVRIC